MGARAQSPGLLARVVIAVARATLGWWLRLHFRMRASGIGLVRTLEPPWLLLGNHVSYWDPILANVYVPHTVAWVSADANYRSAFLRFALTLTRAIAKMQARADLGAVLSIVSAARAGRVVGLFPEGRRTWSGRTMPVLTASAKLVKMLRIPVVTCTTRGGFLSDPRWSPETRPGRMELHYRLLFKPEELRRMPLSEVESRLNEALYQDDWEWSASRPELRYRSRNPAEHAHIAFHSCPGCGVTGSLLSYHDELSCANCGFTAVFTSRSVAIPANAAGISDLHGWFLWQRELLEQRSAQGHYPTLRAGPVRLSLGPRSADARPLRYGYLELTAERLQFRSHCRADLADLLVRRGVPREHVDERGLSIPLSLLESPNVHDHEKIECYARQHATPESGRHFYSFRPRDPVLCGLLWYDSLLLRVAAAQAREDLEDDRELLAGSR